MIKLFDPTQPPEVKKAILDVLESGRFVKGPKVEEFEKVWAEKCGKKYAIAVGSGAQALELAIRVVFKDKTKVSINSDVFKAVYNAVHRMVKVAVIEDRPQLFVHHHHDISLDYKPLLEDCSHCHGYRPKAETAIFSFYPSKILGAVGEAGIIVTDNLLFANQMRYLRSHGEPDGTNARMDEIQAAVLLAKFPYLDEYNFRRNQIRQMYDDAFEWETPGNFHYVYIIEGSQEKMIALAKMGIETNFYYSEEELAIPFHPNLTDEEVREVIRCVKSLS